MDSPHFVHIFRLPFAFVSSVFAYYCIAPSLQTKTSRRTLIGIIILHEVLVNLYLFISGLPHSVVNELNQWESHIQVSNFNFDNNRHVMETTVMVFISEMLLTVIFAVCKCWFTTDISEGKAISQLNGSGNSLPIQNLHSSHNTALDLPPAYHEAIQMT